MSEMNLDNIATMKQKDLAVLIERLINTDGVHDTMIPALNLIRVSQVSEPLHSIYEPSLCVIAQGSKIIMLGNETYQYDPASYLIASVHLPVTGHIIQASPQCPYLGLRLTFNLNQILDIINESNQVLDDAQDLGHGILISRTNENLLDALLRLVNLLDTPEDIPVLSHLVTKEILYRILNGEHGYRIKQFAMMGSHSQTVVRAIKYINDNFSKNIKIEQLARNVGLSPSSLHNYFKKVTAMSPLQYQKMIRLQEARRLLLSEELDAVTVSFKVGYESPSQFNREYARMFGLPPIKDKKQRRISLTSNF